MKRRAPADDAAPRRSARNDPAQRARVARERAAAQDRREREALDKALEAEAKRIRRLPEIVFDATGTAASPEGLARWRLAAADVEALRGAQDAIAAQIDKMPWAGGSDDGDKRWRGYGLPPGARRRLGAWCARGVREAFSRRGDGVWPYAVDATPSRAGWATASTPSRRRWS
jgi:hypothetical protein